MLSGSIYLKKPLYMGYNVVIRFFTRRITKMTYEEIVKEAKKLALGVKMF